MGWSSMELKWDLRVFIFIEYLDRLDAEKMLKPTMSWSRKCLRAFSSFVSMFDEEL